jgi:hypothetical protein
MNKIKAFFTSEKFIKWAKNSLVFLAPALVIFLTAIQNGVPVKQAMYSVYLWGLNVLIDALKKVTGNTSVK